MIMNHIQSGNVILLVGEYYPRLYWWLVSGLFPTLVGRQNMLVSVRNGHWPLLRECQILRKQGDVLYVKIDVLYNWGTTKPLGHGFCLTDFQTCTENDPNFLPFVWPGKAAGDSQYVHKRS